MEQTETLVKTIVKGIQEKKGSNIVIADLSGIDGTICRNFVICQGGSPAQVEAITESIGDMARMELQERPARVAGLENAHPPWYGSNGSYQETVWRICKDGCYQQTRR